MRQHPEQGSTLMGQPNKSAFLNHVNELTGT